MLTHLTIKNYALIKHLELEPSANLNVITGETGAGKSIMLGAIGLLLGNRADTKALWNKTDKCITEGTFDIRQYALKDLFEAEGLDYEELTVIRREISPTGKSRAFINDTPVTLEVMRKIGFHLMDIHSQHETLELGSKSFQLSLIDSYAENEALRNRYSLCWKKYVAADQALAQLKSESSTLKKESEFILFQLTELVQAKLQEGELEKLESDLKILEHAEEIKTQFNSIVQQMSQSEFAVTASLAAIRTQLQSIASYSPAYEHLLQRLESTRIELNDILNEIEQAEEKIEYDPQMAEALKERVGVIYQLQHKHRVSTVAQLIELQEALQRKADKVNNLDELLTKAQKEFDDAQNELHQAAQALSKSRTKAFAPLSKQLVQLLKELGIQDAALAIENSTIAPGSRGIDSVELLFSANKGVAPKPLAQVASGGEFARVMFSIKYVMAEKTSLPTLILDEIDSGVSGEIAIRLGDRMKEMAKRHQLITISHLPQIAAKADTHFFVFKDNSSTRTVTDIKKLTEQERITEIAKMIGGAQPTALTLENARELMNP